MNIELPFLTRRRSHSVVPTAGVEARPDRCLETLERFQTTLSELSAAVAQITKSQFQMTALVESQADTLEEAVEQIKESLAQKREREYQEKTRADDDKALAALLREFLPVVDGLDRIMAFVRQNGELNGLSFGPALAQGLAALVERTRQALAALGVTRIQTVGASFDPYRHHAVKAVTASDPGMINRVVEEIMAGYETRDRVVRPASVVVAVAQTGL